MIARGDCDRVEVAGSVSIWENEGAAEGCAALLSAPLLLVLAVVVAELVAAVLSVARADAVAAKAGVRVIGPVGSEVAEAELCAVLVALLLALA